MAAMLQMLWLIPALPLAGFLALALGAGRAPRRAAAIGVGSVVLSAAAACLVGLAFAAADLPGPAYRQTLWTWTEVAGFSAGVTLSLDALSLTMVLVVTLVGSLIHLYSAGFMRGDPGYARFFTYMNLFIGSMLTLVLADNLLPLYLGWEGVGLCSYLLIGFWYTDPANGRAAQKAFLVTRAGDTAFLLGLLLLATRLGTLQIPELLARAAAQWPAGSTLPAAAAALVLVGALGKSAQLPLQVWLPDAMAGPTPVSALIHAATMVTAGVYLVARLHGLFELAPAVHAAVAVIGASTLFLAAASALVQRDIKRVLAYSTISQIGYMFLALGVGAWPAAVFHLVTHACFKALLFLGAGAVILALHHEHDLERMGGLRGRLPLVFWTFLIGGASLAGLPLVTAGYYSKEAILSAAWSWPHGGAALWTAGLAGALLTALYSFRLIFRVFFGPVRTEPTDTPGPAMSLPLVVLAVLSLLAGFLDAPDTPDGMRLSRFLGRVLPVSPALQETAGEGWLQATASAAALLGAGLAAAAVLWKPRAVRAMAGRAWAGRLVRWALEGWGFDRLYDRLLVRPFLRLAGVLGGEVVDRFYDALAAASLTVARRLQFLQTGRVRWYAAVLAGGSIAILVLVTLGVRP